MDGVTILNTYNTFSTFCTVLLTLGVIGAALFFAFAMALFDDDVFFGGVLMGLAVVLIIVCFNMPKNKTVYEIILDDGVSWNEFEKHYKVLQVRGKILRVEERRADDD